MDEMIRLYLLEDYKSIYPSLRSKALTERILLDILAEEGIADPDILRTGNDKPYEKDGKICFSLSHSGGLLACALSSHEIGLDIEQKTPRDPMALAKRFFTREEIVFLEGIIEPSENSDCSGDTGRPGPGAVAAAFRRLWTRKEALLKYRGSTMEEIMGREPVIHRDDVDFIHLELAEDTIGCLCIPMGEKREVEIRCFGGGEL